MQIREESPAFNYWHKPAEQSAGRVERYFYRCPSCLMVCAVSSRSPQPSCESCNVRLEFMGQVERDKIVREYDAPACDDRCTSARGPSCECKCLGQNHGSHLWVTVRIVNDLPVVSPSRDAEKYRKQAEVFKLACDTARATIKSKHGQDFERFQNRDWIENREAWSDIHYGLKAIHKAVGMREQHSRMRAINKVIEKFGGSPVGDTSVQAKLF